MTLYQRVAYLKPSDIIEIEPVATGGSPLGAALFRGTGSFTYNTYAGPGVFPCPDQGLIALIAADSGPSSPYGSYANAGYRVITKADGTMDTLPFMEAMASLCSYGTLDEEKTPAQLAELIKTRPAELRCGYVGPLVDYCASIVGVQVRDVRLLNVTQPNHFDDGHVLREAKVGGVWKLFDVPNDYAWEDNAGNLLSLAEVIQTGPANRVPRLLAPHRNGRSEYSIYPNCMQVFYELEFRSEQKVIDWCNRIYEVPGMAQPNGGIVWGVPAHLSSYASSIANYPGTNGLWTTMPFDQWVDLYY